MKGCCQSAPASARARVVEEVREATEHDEVEGEGADQSAASVRAGLAPEDEEGGRSRTIRPKACSRRAPEQQHARENCPLAPSPRPRAEGAALVRTRWAKKPDQEAVPPQLTGALRDAAHGR
jgi:hypothetical protein